MKKIEIIIESLEKVDTILPGSFSLGDGMIRILQEDYNIVDTEYNKLGPDGKPLVMREKLLNFTNRQDIKVISYNIDDEGSPATDYDKRIKKAIDKFFMMNPLTLVNGLPHDGTLQGKFDVIDPNARANSELILWNKKLKVANYLKDMDEQELKDICYYIGEDPKNRSVGELLLFIADFDYGALFVSKTRLQAFFDAFINNADPMRQFKVIARKAIEYGVVQTQLKNGVTSYYINGDFAGSTVEHLVEYLKRNERIFNEFILREVEKKSPSKTKAEHKQALKDSADKGPVATGLLRTKVFNLIEDLDAAKIEHGIKKNTLTGAGYDSLEKAYNELIQLIDKVPNLK